MPKSQFAEEAGIPFENEKAHLPIRGLGSKSGAVGMVIYTTPTALFVDWVMKL